MGNIETTVIKNNYCIGCGVCAVASDKYKIKLNEFGQYQSNYLLGNMVSNVDEDLVNKVCPFSNDSLNESELSKSIFSGEENDYLGRVDDLFIGYSTELRKIGASGGATTWFLLKIIEEKLVDGVIHLKKNVDTSGETIFEYDISNTKEEVLSAAKTKYYPGELSKVLKKILKNKDKKYAIVGVPCFIKSVRLLSNEMPSINERLTMFVGLVCGHYKSSNYALMLAFQKGIRPNKIKEFDFRFKTGKGTAGSYNTKITYDSDGKSLISNESVKSFYGTDWGLGMFKYNACDYCDDVVAETADVVFGDAWISPYTKDPMGTNIIISRSKLVSNIFKKASEKNEFVLEEATKEQIIKTQLAGFRHRREGLKLRIKWKVNKKQWYPKKRIENKNVTQPSLRYKMIYFLRILITKYSHIYFNIALKYNSFRLFKFLMFPLLFFYKYVLYAPNRIKVFILKYIKKE